MLAHASILRDTVMVECDPRPVVVTGTALFGLDARSDVVAEPPCEGIEVHFAFN